MVKDYQIINGKKYRKRRFFRSKEKAEKRAKESRLNGNLASVVPRKGGFLLLVHDPVIEHYFSSRSFFKFCKILIYEFYLNIRNRLFSIRKY